MVVSSQRSGSTLLCRDIQSLGGLGNPKEYFLPARKKKNRTSGTPQDVMDWIAEGITPGEPNVAAVKMMVNVARPVNMILRGEPTEQGNVSNAQAVIDWAKREYEAVNLVFLVRENTVEQAISRILARRTGRYHTLNSDVADAHHQALRDLNDDELYPDLIGEAQVAATQRRELEALAKANSDIGLFLTYSQLIRDEPGTSALIYDHASKLGFAPKRRIVQRSLKKAVPNDVAARLKAGLAAYLDSEILQHLK